MKKKRTYIDYLRDIVDYASKAERFVQGIDFERFQSSEEKWFAAVRALEVIGEAAKNIPKDIKEKHSEIPWKEIAGMRDKVVHGYFGVDLEVVWRTIHEDLPPLRAAIVRVLSELEATKNR
jgi:uncharacterized protein with HEPN domain